MNREVYWLHPLNSTEILLYDFSLGIGDTLNQYIYDFVKFGNTSDGMVDSIKQITKYGKSRPTVFTTGIFQQ